MLPGLLDPAVLVHFSGEIVVSAVDELDDLERGDEVLVERDGAHYILEVTHAVLEPVFPPHIVAEEIDLEPLPGAIVLSLESEYSIYNLRQEIDPEDESLGPIELDVKSCIDVRHPPRYRWRELGEVDRVERLENGSAGSREDK